MSPSIQNSRYLLYREPLLPDRPRRLLVLSHGVGGNENNLMALAARAPEDTAVVLVRGPLTLGPNQYAWFRVTFGPGGPLPDLAAAEASRARLASFVAETQSKHRIAPAHTVVAGFSQGGIMSASVALTRPDLVAGFAVLAGRILPELESQLAEPNALTRLQGFIGHGREDTKLPVDWAHRADAWLTKLQIRHETRLYPGGHAIPAAMQSDFFAWFEQVTAPASDERV